MALVIHRAWSNLGFKMWTWLAWFITFNFINIAWVFFRAKEWDDAMKVLGAMFSLDNVVLPEKYFKFLADFSDVYFTYGLVYENIMGKDKTTVFLLIGFLFVLLFKSSYTKLQEFKPTYLSLSFTIIVFLTAVSMMSTVSEFLYFNF
jgi:D-alanyl-lipoteichoic acid acyltransferase DltB (MBOAT superfamily)